jgi:hypothetical protein
MLLLKTFVILSYACTGKEKRKKERKKNEKIKLDRVFNRRVFSIKQ